MSRNAIAKDLKVPVSRLRIWEAAGLVPAHGSVRDELYRDRVVLILAARARLTMQRLREALGTGGC